MSSREKKRLAWWKDTQHLFLNLAAVAKQYLAVQAFVLHQKECSERQIYCFFGKYPGWTQIVTGVMFLLRNLETFQKKMAEIETNDSK